MKVKIIPSKDQTLDEAEFLLEKALKAKRKVRDQQYAKESYKNQHLDEFHDLITKSHDKMLEDIVKEIGDLLKNKLKV